MRRKRSRTKINWGPVFWILFVINVFVGIGWSRLTSIGKVRVERAMASDQKRIEAVLQYIHDQPALQVNKRFVESKLLEKSSVSKAEMTRNIFGRALVTLEYRRAVARIGGIKGAALSREGVIFQSDEDISKLPAVVLPPSALDPSMTLAGRWRSGETAGISAELADLANANPLTIYVLESGGLCLNIGSKFAVRLGPMEQLDDKIDFLRKRLDESPELLVSGKTLVLVRLDRPMYMPGVAKE